MTRWAAVATATLALGGCGPNENPAIRSFHSSVKPGTAILDVVREAERVQKEDVSFAVVSQDCPGPFVSIGRVPGNLHIRVTQPSALSNPSSEPGYIETGYPSRDEFLRGLQEQLPRFYSCRKFRLEFGRDQLWPTTDVFIVAVSPGGEIASVSDLSEE